MAADDFPKDDRLPEWESYLATLSEARAVLADIEGSQDETRRQEVYLLLAKSFSGGMFSAMSDPDYPDFVPSVNTVLNTVGVNPDFIYGYTKINGEGTYRLSGYRGDGLFLIFDFVAGGLGVLDELGPSLGALDIDKFTIGPDGAFDILLSVEKPAGYQGDWYPLDPRTRTLNVRQASYHWGVDREARIAIERLDPPARPRVPDGAEIARRLDALMAYPRFYAGFVARHIHNLRSQGFVNRLQHDDWAGRGGVEGQHYYQGIFQIEPGHALILETELPERVRYWNVQLSDMLWNSVNWMNHQSSLNAAQARLDGDGKFRAVIASEDPGVANWLDTGGLLEGTLMLRWNEASSGPVPTLRSVPLARLREELPADTRYLSAEERRDSLRERRRAVQLRRRW
ncbi:MAG: DUF1214 domain-containing protein [Porticoccaceae bacterium]|jgi:hypothetical protein|nr:DUF1214 domain-containing protein [Porticoccaceae bacterium]